MTREQRIIETFVQMADTMVDDFDVVDFLHRLAAHCVELLDCAEAGLLLADAAGALRVMASSSERAESLELLQSQNAEGPSYECYQLGEVVLSEDLKKTLDRWPMFAPAAMQNGYLSVYAIPMRVRRETVGALNLLRLTAGPIAESDMTLGQGLADIAAVALLQERSLRESRSTVEQLQEALSSRVVIEQAKGVLAQQAQITVDAAFAQLRTYARSNNYRLSEVAREVIDGRLDAVRVADLEPRNEGPDR